MPVSHIIDSQIDSWVAQSVLRFNLSLYYLVMVSKPKNNDVSNSDHTNKKQYSIHLREKVKILDLRGKKNLMLRLHRPTVRKTSLVWGCVFYETVKMGKSLCYICCHISYCKSSSHSAFTLFVTPLSAFNHTSIVSHHKKGGTEQKEILRERTHNLYHNIVITLFDQWLLLTSYW